MKPFSASYGRKCPLSPPSSTPARLIVHHTAKMCAKTKVRKLPQTSQGANTQAHTDETMQPSHTQLSHARGRPAHKYSTSAIYPAANMSGHAPVKLKPKAA